MPGANVFIHEPRDTNLKRAAFAVAVLIHLAVLLIRLPATRSPEAAPPRRQTVSIRRYIPPPPPVESPQISIRRTERRLPVPDPTPDDLEPVPEPPLDVEPVLTTPDIEILIGSPEPPVRSTTLVAGVGDVTEPVRLPESYVEPEYPEEARVARVEGSVILEVVIRSDGTVGDVNVLGSDEPNLGFESAAIAAIRQWRYEPARYRNEPVDVYYTVMIEFDLM